GTDYCDIHFEHYSKQKSAMEKAEFIETFVNEHPEVERDFSAADFKNALKGMKRKGYMSKVDIVWKKQLESTVNSMYETIEQIFIRGLQSEGLFQLKPIADKKDMGIMAISLKDQE